MLMPLNGRRVLGTLVPIYASFGLGSPKDFLWNLSGNQMADQRMDGKEMQYEF